MDVEGEKLDDSIGQECEKSIVDSRRLITILVVCDEGNTDEHAADRCEEERHGNRSPVVFPKGISELREWMLRKAALSALPNRSIASVGV